jgi:hypothetical protein
LLRVLPSFPVASHGKHSGFEDFLRKKSFRIH